MLYGFNANQDKEINEFHQRVADQNIQSIEDHQDEIQNAKNGFIGMLAGILVGGVVGWIFLGPAENPNKEPVIPVIRRPLIPAKIQPNEPGGMEIDNQDREIYHIVDNTPKQIKEVNIRPAPDMPKMVVENVVSTPENIEELVESIEDSGNLNNANTDIDNFAENNIKVVSTELSAIKTNSNEKIIIPEKIKNVEVILQKNINPMDVKVDKVPEKITEIKQEKPKENKVSSTSIKMAKGTWYTQIIASSSQKAVQSLWQNLSAKHAFLKKYPYEIEEITSANGSKLYRLKVGAFSTRNDATKLAEKLKQNQISSIIKQN